jgi:hypothetical protein
MIAYIRVTRMHPKIYASNVRKNLLLYLNEFHRMWHRRLRNGFFFR